MNLSKSKYCRGIQCKKLLWLTEYKPEVSEDIDNSSVFENGEEVGDLAKGLFGDYIDIEFNYDLSKMIEDTNKVINNCKICNITEASFLYDNNFCSVDILRKNNNKYEIYEVKSSTKVSDIYKEDATYQYYVLTKLGYKVEKICIVYINNKYVRYGKLEIDKLFNIEDITDYAKNNIDVVEKNIEEINKAMKQSMESIDCVGLNCFDPYNCPFFKYCTRHLSSPNIFDISGLNKNKMIECYREGKTSFKDLIKEELGSKYLEQIDFEINNKKDKIDEEKIEEFLNTLSFPLYFLDFETYQQTIPLYDGINPYGQIPFQYSLHYIEKEGEKVKHKEFLAEADIDPRRMLAERLVEDIPKNVCVLAYHMNFEKKVIARLAELYPDLEDHLLNINDNIKDLEIPFAKRYYYTKDMKGKSSIKYVLPALFPNEPSLNYKNLEGIHNGSEAMNSFANLKELSKEEQKKVRHNLLKYCELDTYAMVKIWERLINISKK